MGLQRTEIFGKGVKFSLIQEGIEVARAFVYILYNDLHPEPFALMEDVFVEEALRGQGLGSQLVKQVIAEAQKQGCYKLICTSRYANDKVHKWYEKLGFKNYGKEFRVDF